MQVQIPCGLITKVRMRSIYESKGEVFIVLELADGGELFDRIVKKGHYSEKEAARVCFQVLRALEVSWLAGSMILFMFCLLTKSHCKPHLNFILHPVSVFPL